MPFRDFDVEDIVVEIFDILKIFHEVSLQLHQVLGVLRALNTTKDWNQSVLPFESELKLAFADLDQVFASLDEGLILGEDGLIGIQLPALSRGILFEHVLVMNANSLPFLAAVNALVEIRNAFLDVAFKHVHLVDLGSASLDDLVGNLGQETLHSLGGVVVFTQLPDDSHVVKRLRQNLRDVLWAALLDLSAWFGEHAQVLKVVLSLVISSLDFLLKLDEAGKIRARGVLKNLDDLLELVQLKSFGQNDQVGSSLVPVSNLVEWTLDCMVGRGILVGDELFDLLSPVNHGGLESLKEILVFGSSIDVSKILIRNIEEGLSSGSMRGFIKESHELVKVHDEVLLDTIRPIVLLKELLDVLGLHLLEQVVKRIITDESELHTLLQIGEGDWHIPVLLNEEDHLEVLGQDVLTVEFRRLVVTHSEDGCIIKIHPEEQALLFRVAEEGVELSVVLLLPMLF